MDEESDVYDYVTRPIPEPFYVCKCLLDDSSSEDVKPSARKQRILTTVARTEAYLRERRIPELIRFMMTKLLVEAPSLPVQYLEKLMDSCMLFRAGHGQPPLLYHEKHLKEVIKSFDPGQRGWLSPGQILRVYTTLGLPLEVVPEDKLLTDEVLENLKRDQEAELYHLLAAGLETGDSEDTTTNKTGSTFSIPKFDCQ